MTPTAKDAYFMQYIINKLFFKYDVNTIFIIYIINVL